MTAFLATSMEYRTIKDSTAGACTSLWLAFHDDLADANTPDPIAREST
jgi:hypothetical protein